MSTAVLDQFITERDEVLARAEAITANPDFDPSDEELVALKTRSEALDTKIRSMREWSERRNDANAFDAKAGKDHRAVQAAPEPAPLWTPGEMFVRSDQMADYRGYGASPVVEIEGMLTRAALDTSDFTLPKTARNQSEPAFYTPVTDSIPIIPVTTNAVDVMTWTWGDTAAVVAENANKPEASLTQALISTTLDTIAHWISYSRQLAADSGAVMAKIDNGLRRGVLAKLESEAGAAVVAGTYTNVVDAAGILSGVRTAVGQLQALGYNPNVVYLNPADWAALDVSVQGAQTLGGTGQVQQSYWGLRVVPLATVSAGTSIVADTQAAFEIYRRTGVQMFTTDSHASLFIANTLVTLAEARQKTVVTNPAAVRTTSAA